MTIAAHLLNGATSLRLHFYFYFYRIAHRIKKFELIAVVNKVLESVQKKKTLTN